MLKGIVLSKKVWISVARYGSDLRRMVLIKKGLIRVRRDGL